jgi:hypothetical protein
MFGGMIWRRFPADGGGPEPQAGKPGFHRARRYCVIAQRTPFTYFWRRPLILNPLRGFE